MLKKIALQRQEIAKLWMRKALILLNGLQKNA